MNRGVRSQHKELCILEALVSVRFAVTHASFVEGRSFFPTFLQKGVCSGKATRARHTQCCDHTFAVLPERAPFSGKQSIARVSSHKVVLTDNTTPAWLRHGPKPAFPECTGRVAAVHTSRCQSAPPSPSTRYAPCCVLVEGPAMWDRCVCASVARPDASVSRMHGPCRDSAHVVCRLHEHARVVLRRACVLVEGPAMWDRGALMRDCGTARCERFQNARAVSRLKQASCCHGALPSS